MRFIQDHIIHPTNDTLSISVEDEPGQGGACHRYVITGMTTASNASSEPEDPDDTCLILFQNGPIGDFGVNGVTQEALLAVVIDRLRSFQAGPFSSRENAVALTKCEEALHWLQQRTVARMRRGVEGTNVR